MLHFHIFADGSVNPQLNVGYGAYLVLPYLNVSIDSIQDKAKVKRFEQTSSTKLELQILLWALGETIAIANTSDISLTAYTDSQNIISLPGRRTRLENSNYYSSKNKRLNNFELYQEFYQLTSKINCKFIKVKGHQPSSVKGDIEKIFGLVDQASRRALREHT